MALFEQSLRPFLQLVYIIDIHSTGTQNSSFDTRAQSKTKRAAKKITAAKKDISSLSPWIFHFMTIRIHHDDHNDRIAWLLSLRIHDIIISKSGLPVRSCPYLFTAEGREELTHFARQLTRAKCSTIWWSVWRTTTQKVAFGAPMSASKSLELLFFWKPHSVFFIR